MKTFLAVLLLFAANASAEAGLFSLGYADLPLGVTATYGYALPISYQHSFLSSFSNVPLSNYLDVQLQPAKTSVGASAISTTGTAEKPVREPTLEQPPSTVGGSISVALPQTNVYSLGSGSLGAVHLDDGRLALGSGSLGYTQRAPSTRTPFDPILEDIILQQISRQQTSYIEDRRPQNFGLGALPNLPQTNITPPPETRGYASTPGLSSARS